MGSIIAFVIATGLGGSLLYFLADAQTFIRMRCRMGGERTESPWGDWPNVPGELRPARNMAEGGASEQGGRAVKGQDRTHDKTAPTS
jgi:hypothetical protein